jgi:hypothetical protein
MHAKFEFGIGFLSFTARNRQFICLYTILHVKCTKKKVATDRLALCVNDIKSFGIIEFISSTVLDGLYLWSYSIQSIGVIDQDITCISSPTTTDSTAPWINKKHS